jgi:hypothetical protein
MTPRRHSVNVNFSSCRKLVLTPCLSFLHLEKTSTLVPPSGVTTAMSATNASSRPPRPKLQRALESLIIGLSEPFSRLLELAWESVPPPPKVEDAAVGQGLRDPHFEAAVEELVQAL